MIAFRHLGKSYGAFTAVRDLEFSVERGEVFGFLGPNGAGKTTTIRMLMGILVPSSGSVTIDGLDCQADRVELKRRVGYLPDNPMFYDYLRGREILQFVGEMHGHARPEAERRTAALLEELALDDAAEEYAANYSAGMKKKLGLACALIHDPLVLILDEPTNGLDPRAAREVQERLRHQRRAGHDDLSLHASAEHGGAPLLARRDHPQGGDRRGRAAARAAGESRSRRIAGGSVPESHAGGRGRGGQRVTRSIHALRPAWLLARLRLRRALNQMQAISRYRAGSPDRKAASRTSPTAGLLSALLGVTMLASFTFMAYQAIGNIESTLGSVQMRRTAPVAADRATRPESHAPSAPRRRAAAPGSVLSEPVLHAVAFEATLILVTILSIMLAGRDFARPEWDLEWLATLPFPLPTLLLCRLIERVFTSASGMLGLLPFLSVLAWTCGYRWAAPLLGIALTLALLFIAATIQLMVDTGLRLSLSPPQAQKSSCGDFPRQRAAAAPRHGHGHPRQCVRIRLGCRAAGLGDVASARPRGAGARGRGWRVGARVVQPSCWSRFSFS